MFYIVNEFDEIVGHYTKLSKDRYQMCLYKNLYPVFSKDELLRKLYELDLSVRAV